MVEIASKIFQNWAFRTMVAMTPMYEMFDGAPHRTEFGDLAVNTFKMTQRERLHVGTRAFLLSPQGEKIGHVFYGETETSGVLDETQGLQIVPIEIAITVGPATRGGNQTDTLVVTDGLGGNSRFRRNRADIHCQAPFTNGRASGREPGSS